MSGSFFSKIAGFEYEFESTFKALRAGQIGPKKSILIKGNSGDGQTAVALEISKEFLIRGHTVIFFDYFDAILRYRIPDFENLPFVIARPDGARGTREILNEFRLHGLERPILCFDSSYLVSDEEDEEVYKNNLDGLKDLAFNLFPGSTVILTERRNRRINYPNWTEVFEINYERLITKDRAPQGHEITLRGSIRETQAFVDYRTGRLSRPYDWGKEKIQEGANPAAYFEFQGERYRGFWNLVMENNPSDNPE